MNIIRVRCKDLAVGDIVYDSDPSLDEDEDYVGAHKFQVSHKKKDNSLTMTKLSAHKCPYGGRGGKYEFPGDTGYWYRECPAAISYECY